MPSIYQTSFITIAAANSASSDIRFAKSIDGFVGLDDQGAKHYISIIPRFSPHHEMFAHQHGFNDSCSLKAQGWAFQGRVLPSRLLSFTRDEMTYESDSGCVCECGDVKSDEFCNAGHLMKRGRKKYTSFYAYDELEEDLEQPYIICFDPRKRTFATNLRALSLQDTNPKALSVWYEIVTEYNWRDLTYDRDALPALSGIASRVNPGLAGDYCAGTWKNDLIYGLGWERPVPGRLPSTYTAPSFSWASGIGPVR